MIIKMQILDIDYFINGVKPVIRIFGRTEAGTSICAFYDKFYPYFYIKPLGDTKVCAEKLRAMREVIGVEEISMKTPLRYKDAAENLLKITLLNPQEVPKMREKLAAMKLYEEIFEADIMFKYRFMIDNKLLGVQWIEIDAEREQSTIKSKVSTYRINSIKPIEKIENAELKYLAFDIECLPSDPRKPIDPKHDPIIMIAMSFMPQFRNKESVVLVAKPVAADNVKGFSTEKEMLEEFLGMIDSFDPDVLTGYNINGFDFPYIIERLHQNKLHGNLGRGDKEIFSKTYATPAIYGSNQEHIVTGRIVFDPFQILKRDPWVKFTRYDLKTVAKQLLNEEKHAVEYGDMPALWNGDRQQLMKLIEYARKDSALSLKLVIDKGMLDKFFELSKISGLLLQDTFGGQTRRIEIMLLHEFKNRGFVMPSSPSRQELQKRIKERKIKGLKGAIVLEPKKGLHADGCLLVMDFKSLYPSIMMTYNISPDTVLPDEHTDIKSLLSPAGARFVEKSIYKGIFPDVLSKLIEARNNIKKIMKTKKGEEKRILNAKQLALKDISNSFYGYTGYIRARLYMIDVANSITAYGRENIEMTRKLVEDNFDVEVVYGDTDSIFVKTKLTNLDDAKELGEKISRLATERLTGHLELEFEKIYRTFLILTKKRYAGWKFEFSDGKWSDEIEMRGIETVRRDWCPLVSETMTNVLNMTLKEGDVQKAIGYVKEIVDKLKKNEIPAEKLTIVKGIAQSLESYKGILPHIELARKLAARNPHSPPKVGDRLGFVIIKGNQMLSKRAEDPAYVERHNIAIDSDYYIYSQLLPPIERILSSVGVEMSEVLGNGHQINLEDLISGKKRKLKHDIEINYSKKENEDQALLGWEEFVCTKCKKSYRRAPLQGSCECGGELLIGYRGSLGNKVVTK